MEDVLSNTVSKLKSKDYSSVTVVLGNESCDLDSAISSLVYAIFLHWQYQKIHCGVCTRTSDDVKHEIFVPLLDVDREDFELKTEVAYSLKEVGITKELLVFRDDLNLQELVQTVTTRVILVDHHVLCKKYEYLAPYVTEIIDHRPLDRSGWKYKEDTRSTIEVVGSCCTLVGQRIKDLSALLSKDMEFFNAYPVCARLLHSVILLDTVNFSKEVNKATPQDEEIVLFLENVIKPNDCHLERKTLVDRLVAARCDVSALTAAQLLRKDVKVIADILVPSFPILVEEFLAKPDAIPALDEALTQRQCSVGVLLGMKLGAQLQRDVAVYARNDPAITESLARGLQQWTRPSLGLSQSPAIDCLYFTQSNLAASRKQYLPALTHFLSQQ
ncbi:exopolyphosphatase PRUNE1 [Epargyreus clarus]|uniref:exopolyphosphatase PRUNE1 n=1 Tax=Epargyreus clarus TaxID=520877 RepID=UPI003C2E9E14